eukprot:761512-Hanusia_phi.AAC.2
MHLARYLEEDAPVDGLVDQRRLRPVSRSPQARPTHLDGKREAIGEVQRDDVHLGELAASAELREMRTRMAGGYGLLKYFVGEGANGKKMISSSDFV